MLVMYLLPLIALIFDSNLTGVTYPDFFVRISLIWVILSVMVFWCRKQRWLRPVDVKMLSWEGTLFLCARWPWSLIGTIAAVVDWVRGATLEFRVTPKGRIAAEPLPLRVLAPYAFLSAASGLLPIVLLSRVKIALGFCLFAGINSLLYAVLLLVIIIMHRCENPIPRRRSDRNLVFIGP